MRIALCSMEGRVELDWNLSQMEKMAIKAKNQNVDMLFFGEAFLQGKDSVTFDYARDVELALGLHSEALAKARNISATQGIALGFGFYENWKGGLYASYLVVHGSKNILHQRALSPCWKKAKACADYREGKDIAIAHLQEKSFAVVIGDDLLDDECIWSISEKDPEVDFFLWFHRESGSLENKKRALLRSEILAKPVMLIQGDQAIIMQQGKIKRETKEELLQFDI